MVQPRWKTAGGLLRDLEAELPYDPAILLTGIYPQKKKRKKNGEIRISQRCTHACVHGSQDVQTACTSVADR